MGRPTPVPRLRGRQTEIAALSEALDRVASGRYATVLIDGEAGIGKTRLLATALEDARGRGMQVAAARAVELEQTRPFGLLAEALGCTRSSRDPRRAAIAELLAAGVGDRTPITVTSDPGLRFRAVDALTDLAEEIALTGPLVIGADDLQWADPSSLLTLAALSRRLAYLPVAIIGCLRPSPQVAELDGLAGLLLEAGGRLLTLRSLADAAVTELVAEAVAAAPGPGLLARISGAGGNPLFITELVGALLQEGAIETSGGQAEVAEMMLPPTLRLTILRRLSFLPDETLHALRAASILGSGFTVTELSHTMARPVLELSAVLAEGIRGRVLEDDSDRLRFRHDLIRDAIYEDLPLSVRQGLHREAGQRLAGSGAPALQVAEHLARGAGPGDTEAIGWLTRAAREAVAASPDAAADLLERAIGLMNPVDPDRDRLLTERASSLMLAGRAAPAEDVCRALLNRDYDSDVDGPIRICLGRALLAQGRASDALRELQRASESPMISDAEGSIAKAWASNARLWLGDLDGTAALAEQARSAAAAAKDHLSTSIALRSLAEVPHLRGCLRDALRIMDDAVHLADQSPGRQGHGYPLHANRGLILVELDRFEEARATIETGARISEELGLGWHLPSYQMVRTAERFTAGEWDDAIAEIEASIQLADETGQAFGLILGRSVLSLISLHRGDLSRANQAAAAAVGQLAEAGVHYRAQWALWARALVLEADGKTADAYVTLTGCWDQYARLGHRLGYRMLGPDLTRLALANGDRERARDTAAAVAGIADQNPEVPSLAGIALRCQGLAEDDTETLQAAVAAYASRSRPLELALTSEEAGTALARHGMADQARPFVDQALEIYERLDAARDAARAEAVLRQTGIRRGRRGPRGRPQTGWASLTPAERTIAGLVAEGLSNPKIGDRLYISHRTVQTHLAHVFTKLDITSRAQLAAEVTRHRER
jgi:DNA-binding CsgD family transcriptional regulator/tetratricopeptide (TPR) repeat protein